MRASLRWWLVGLTLSFASPVLARGTSVLTGTVTDAATGSPLDDVTVVAVSPALQGREVAKTDASGQYRLNQLPPGVYTLQLEREGYQPFVRPDVNLRADRTVRVNVQMRPTTFRADEVVVVGRAPTVDVGTTTTGLTVTKELVDSVPFIVPSKAGVRTFESLAQAAPQVVSDQYGPGISGTTSPENLILVDGLSVNDPAFGTNGAALPTDFLEEVNVITGGYQAEYGRATGGVLSATTKSGSNEFHGSVFGNWTPGALSGLSPEVKNHATIFRTNQRLWNSGDFGIELGGPVVKDKLWFYVGFSPSFSRVQEQRRLFRFVADANGDPVINELGQHEQEELPGTRQTRFVDSRAYSYLAKLTWAVAPNHHLTASASGSPTSTTSPREFAALLSGATTTNANSDLSVRYSGNFFEKHLLVDGTVGWHRQLTSNLPSDGSTFGSTTGAASVPQIIARRSDPHSILAFESLPAEAAALCDPRDSANATRCPATSAGSEYVFGGFGEMNQATLDRVQVRGSATALFQALGHHIAKAGVDFERLQFDVTKGYSGGTVLRESANGGSFRDYYRYGYFTGPDEFVEQPFIRQQSASNAVGLYLQDGWSVLDKVTLNVGLRYETQQLFAGDGTLGLTLNNMLSPRVGLIYDFTQQGRSKIYAHYARYYEAVPLDLADRGLTGENAGGFNNLKGTTPPCDPIADPGQANTTCHQPGNDQRVGSPSDPNQTALVTGQGKTPVDPALQPQSIDEIVVGAEYEVLPDTRVGVSYMRRSQNAVVEDLSRDEGNTYFIGNPGSGLAKDFPKATRDYDAVTFVLTKAFTDQWLMQVSYTWSYLRGNYSGLFRPETGQLDPNIGADFDLVSLLANRDGPLPGDRTHVIKAYGAKQFTLTNALDLLVGVTYEGASGRPINYLASHPIYGEDEAFVLPRGAGGRLPWTHTINAKVAVSWKATRENTVSFTADVFNLFNFAAPVAVDESLSSSDVLPVTAKTANPQQLLCLAGIDPTCRPQVSKLDGDTGEVVPASVADYNPNFKNVTAYQSPLAVRFGLKVSF